MRDPNLSVERLPPTLWAATASAAPETEPVGAGDREADVVVVGAGFTGLSAALHAAKEGARVVVLDAAEIGWGASGRNTGLVIPAMSRADPDAIASHFGERYGEALVERIGASASILFDLVRAEGIDCDATQSGWIQPAHRPSRMELARSRYDQWRKRGFDVGIVDRDECASIVGSLFWHGGWQAHTGGHVNPLGLARGLARAAIAHGVSVHPRSAVSDIHPVGDGWQVTSGPATIRARAVIIATHSYSGVGNPSPWQGLQQTIVPIRSYQLATEPLPKAVRRSILPLNHAMSDSRGDLHLARFDAAGRLISGCGLIVPYDYRDRVVARLRSRLRQMFPQLSSVQFQVEHVWYGQFAVTTDAMPRFFRIQKGLYAWLGCNGRGVALSCAMGPALARAALNPEKDDAELPFTPMRRVEAQWLVSRMAATVLATYRWRDLRDRI